MIQLLLLGGSRIALVRYASGGGQNRTISALHTVQPTELPVFVHQNRSTTGLEPSAKEVRKRRLAIRASKCALNISLIWVADHPITRCGSCGVYCCRT